MAMCDLTCHTPGATMTSDASGKWVATRSQRAVSDSSYQPAKWERVHITVKAWKGCTVHCLCDNAAVVAILRLALQKIPG